MEAVPGLRRGAHGLGLHVDVLLLREARRGVPGHAAGTTSGTPFTARQDRRERRASYSRTFRSPRSRIGLYACSRNCRVFLGSPSSSTTTYPVSVYPSPAARRSAACRARNLARGCATVDGSGSVRSPASVLRAWGKLSFGRAGLVGDQQAVPRTRTSSVLVRRWGARCADRSETSETIARWVSA